MRHAHDAGLRTTATMMYGTVERLDERIEHLLRLRELQDATGGFTAFITWSFQPSNTELGGAGATGVDYLRTLALARLVLDNFDNLQASWVTQGGKVGQLSLAYGANDMGSVMIEENVVRAAGAAYCMDEVEIVRNIEDAGFVPKRRDMQYTVLGDPIFRERQVAPHERARDRPRGGRHVRAGRSCIVIPRGVWPASAAGPPVRDPDPLPCPLGGARYVAADRGRLGGRRRRLHSCRRGPRGTFAATTRDGKSTSETSAFCPVSSTPTPTWSFPASGAPSCRRAPCRPGRRR